jgi:hypothetical protein
VGDNEVFGSETTRRLFFILRLCSLSGDGVHEERLRTFWAFFFVGKFRKGESVHPIFNARSGRKIMFRNLTKLVTCVLTLAIFIATGQTAMAQSTIFNIPTTDTVAPAKGYFEFDYLVQAPGTEDVGRVQVFAPRIVVGVVPNLEVGVNVFNYRYPGDSSSTFSYFQPNIKYKFVASDDQGIAASAGLIWYTPINHREGADSYGLVYGNFSKKVMSGSYGPRITFGPYGIVGAVDNYLGTKAGAIVGYEQPIHARASIVADWFSGVSGFGYFTPGVSFTLPRSGLLNIGYAIGNDSYSDPGNTNRYFFAYYGITFP